MAEEQDKRRLSDEEVAELGATVQNRFEDEAMRLARLEVAAKYDGRDWIVDETDDEEEDE